MEIRMENKKLSIRTNGKTVKAEIVNILIVNNGIITVRIQSPEETMRVINGDNISVRMR